MRSFVPALAAAALLALPAPAAGADRCGGADRVVRAETRAAAERTMRCLVTRARAAHGARRLRPSGRLRRAATRFARTLVRRRVFAHAVAGVPDLGRRLRAAGYRAPSIRAGENLAWADASIATPRTIVDGWLGSPAHRANMLTPEFRDIGIGIAWRTPDGSPGITVAAVFGLRG